MKRKCNIAMGNKSKRSRTERQREKNELLISFVYLLFSTSVLFCRTLSLRYLLNKLLPRNLLAIWIRAKWQRNPFHFIAISHFFFVRRDSVVLMVLNVSLFCRCFICVRWIWAHLICVFEWKIESKININGESIEKRADWT